MQHKPLLFGIIALLSTALFFLSQDSPAQAQVQEWKQWKQEHGFLPILTADDTYRMLVFSQNMNKIVAHNSKSGQSFTMGLNQFAHLSQEEFSALYSSPSYYGSSDYQTSQQGKVPHGSLQTEGTLNLDTPNVDIDWQKAGKVSVVKNQGNCDAGYTFCSNSLAESYLIMSRGQTLLLSEQQILDCATNYTTFGCDGGSRAGTLQFLTEKGVVSQSKYPWTGRKDVCTSQDSQFKLPGEKRTEFNGCNEMVTGLSTSPMTVAVNIQNWQFYRAGVFSNCGEEVQHDIFLVGVTDQYWRLKNSWGTSWGEDGFIRLSFGNTCGICTRPGFGFRV